MRKFAAAALLLALSACRPDAGDSFQGYVEAEYTMIAPTAGGLLQRLDVVRGQQVAAGAPLFSLDLADLTAARDAAAADVARATAERDDLLTGERPEEIDVIRKQKDQAEATLVQARREYQRVQPLVKSGAVSQTELDNDKAAYDAAVARVAELDARLTTLAMGARTKRVEAANAAINAAEQALVRAEKTLKEAAPLAPATARVDDTFYRPGEYVAPGRPVVSLLVPGNLKVRFFIPQAVLPQVTLGRTVTVNCDGCTQPVKAAVAYIANEAEYTPPVIYSNDSREKLVFMVEATLKDEAAALPAGLPVDVTLDQP
ncbi:MAG TPA: HlyD family efflux transporter periplasmic adaptor subunit [Patescibacteria group bacterium]|nr:HlyD family efflux transporter periplasmic adaptor subunit [Patescibacteria group bacterium]